MTERLYYSDPELREFDARVIRADVIDGRPAVFLDRTAFYPSSGGQPFDTGILGSVRVVDVIDDEGGIRHVMEAPIEEGVNVRGSIDWDRRFDHMQQHTGQHVLSAAFDRLLAARTESFHLGAATSTIDLARPLTPDEISRAEDEANRILWDDRPVAIRFVDASEAADVGLRKESHRTGTLRLIDIADVDVSACGGTHVRTTGAIGQIAVLSSEKFRGGVRIEFVCGNRALSAFRSLREATAGAVKFLSVLPSELPAAVERLQAEVKRANRTSRDLQTRLAEHEAARLIGAIAAGADRVIVEVLEGWDQNGLKAIASAVTRHPGISVALLGSPAPSAVVIARSPDATADASAVLRELTGRFGGKGGGRSDLAQGGGLQGQPHEIASVARTLLDS